jgi:F0F1-type ATP synthase delta subunit
MVNVGYNMKFEAKNLNAIRNLLYEQQQSTKETVFSEGPAALTEEEKQQFAEAISRYSETVESMVTQRNLEEMVNGVSKMVETAERMIGESQNEMLEKVAEKRRLNYVNAAVNELKKAATEVVINERKMEAALNDIGEGLNKYF